MVQTGMVDSQQRPEVPDSGKSFSLNCVANFCMFSWLDLVRNLSPADLHSLKLTSHDYMIGLDQ